eukprot:CAMPEP_0197198158 /NCGR_PEP_ID=MMETSP1423-20130617/33230_1 /TAXON_ID=476441 /ORGANISM="Pseudo-nitzschia heimii, Strain UNC1101" /LENGTH=477 /DNA_ID=CAMNT_0042651987 /DNA_START=112 /DNA_END=1545 /DNA_ORIENTATION=+
MTSIAFRGNTAMMRRQFSSLLTKASASSSGNHFLGGYAPPVSARTPVLRTFSQASNSRTPNSSYAAYDNSTYRNSAPAAAETTDSDKTNNTSFGTISTTEVGTITTPLKKLDKNTVRKIEAELREVDVDHDGRVDSEDLANLLKKHQTAFTDEEIVEFAELFYAGKGGASMTVSEFIQALDEAVSSEEEGRNKHPILDGNCSAEYIYRKSHAAYTAEDLDIDITHREPENFTDRLALQAVKIVRGVFDTATGWSNDSITQDKILNRAIFLETVAAVPGMVAAVTRHFRSLRRMERDGGLMHCFLEEANNERMHLLSFIKMKNPGMLFRAAVIFSQFGFGTAFFLAYIASPTFCHRFVGYIEEEACHTYTTIVGAIEEAPFGSELAAWRTQHAPSIAKAYWKLGETGTVLDLILAVRADEAEHRDVNHACSDLPALHGGPQALNPFDDPEVKVNRLLRKYVKDMMNRNPKYETLISSA